MNSNSYQWYPSPSHDWNQARKTHHYQQQFYNPQIQQLKYHTLSTVEPIVQHGLHEAQFTSYLHAMTEVSAISYLVGRGYDPQTAHRIVESWEVNEVF
ncbi:hypothetical protein [Bacillus sp. FJAT-52991]|uniref:Uncharacterized protein n=1 Tax=Bacillus kandeliae TaxID=3129297 RepID=A0ABZ2N4S2_9BACI